MREIRETVSAEQKVIGFCTALVVLVTLGPFGTYDSFSLPERIAYWSMMLTGVGLLFEFTLHAALTARSLARMPVAARVAVAGAIASVPGTSVVIFVDQVFRDSTLDPADFPRLYWQVLLLGTSIMAVDVFVWRRLFGTRTSPPETQDAPPLAPLVARPPVPSSQPAPPAPAPVPLLLRLPPEAQGGEIVSLSMQDHYVEVTTTRGAHLLLMRLSDAMELLGPVIGAQTHRSHWAAQAHMQALDRKGQKARLTLKDGRRLPVSTRHVEQVQALIDSA